MMRAASCWLYRPLLGWALAAPGPDPGRCRCSCSAGAVALVTRFGSEFMPPLNEGSLLFMPVPLPTISLPRPSGHHAPAGPVIKKVPEVAHGAWASWGAPRPPPTPRRST